MVSDGHHSFFGEDSSLIVSFFKAEKKDSNSKIKNKNKKND